jgi:signal transduction histidine kinase
MELVGVMAAGAVHDLSNLISIILGYSNLFIEENDLDKDSAVSMGKIRQAGEKASDVVGQILRFSRIDDMFEEIDIVTLIDEILSILGVTVPKGVKIKWNRPDEAIYLEGSAIKYQQVLMNLCVNALQAMGKTGKLTISMKREGQDSVRIDVKDTGPGMDKETLEKIFNPLFTTKEPGKGTGLGLFVVKHIVNEYRGSIEVFSESGEGTLFRVHFPLKSE